MTDPTRISDDQHNNAPAPAPARGEPFGYFRAEPFGWTDCSEDAEGAIALYEHPAHEKHWTENEPVRLPSARTDRVYLAGPMTGIAELNFPAFNQEAERLRAEGLQVLNPADHGIVDGADWTDYLRHDIAGLASCERIHLLRGWTKSKGACLEMTIAKALGMTVTYQVDAEIEHNNAPAVPQGWKLVQTPITEEMHVAAVKVLHRAPGLAGLPQRMLDAMLAATPATPSQEPVMWQYRSWFAENTGTPGWSEWAEVKARNAYTGTVMDSVREFQHYIAQGYKYEIRALYAATPAPAPAQEVGLTEAERVMCLIASGCIGTVKMTYDSGPYEITRTSINASRLIDAIIAALRAKGEK